MNNGPGFPGTPRNKRKCKKMHVVAYKDADVGSRKNAIISQSILGTAGFEKRAQRILRIFCEWYNIYNTFICSFINAVKKLRICRKLKIYDGFAMRNTNAIVIFNK